MVSISPTSVYDFTGSLEQWSHNALADACVEADKVENPQTLYGDNAQNPQFSSATDITSFKVYGDGCR